MSKKPRSIRLLRWLDFSQSENRKNNRKTFEGASVEPTSKLPQYLVATQDKSIISKRSINSLYVGLC